MHQPVSLDRSFSVSQYLRDERFPALAGDLYNEAGTLRIYLRMSKKALTLANGANSNIAIGTASFVRITGPSAGFSVSGFAGGAEGRILVINNAVAQIMTITNDATSTAANRILTQTGADVALRAGRSSAVFIYDAVDARWILVASN